MHILSLYFIRLKLCNSSSYTINTISSFMFLCVNIVLIMNTYWQLIQYIIQIKDFVMCNTNRTNTIRILNFNTHSYGIIIGCLFTRVQSGIVFVFNCPGSDRNRLPMIFCSSEEELRRLGGLGLEVCDRTDGRCVSEETFRGRVSDKYDVGKNFFWLFA